MALINWATHVLQWYNKWKQRCKLEQILKQYLSTDCRLQCLYEDGIVSNRESARHGEPFLSFAHTARHVMGVKLAVNKLKYI